MPFSVIEMVVHFDDISCNYDRFTIENYGLNILIMYNSSFLLIYVMPKYVKKLLIQYKCSVIFSDRNGCKFENKL